MCECECEGAAAAAAAENAAHMPLPPTHAHRLGICQQRLQVLGHCPVALSNRFIQGRVAPAISCIYAGASSLNQELNLG